MATMENNLIWMNFEKHAKQYLRGCVTDDVVKVLFGLNGNITVYVYIYTYTYLALMWYIYIYIPLHFYLLLHS